MVALHNRRNIGYRDLLRQGLKKLNKDGHGPKVLTKKMKVNKLIKKSYRAKRQNLQPGLDNPPDQDTHEYILVLKSARASYVEEDLRSNAALYEFIKVGFCVGSHLRDRPEQFVLAVSDSSLPEGSRVRPRALDAPKAVYFATLFIFNPTTQEKRAKAGKYASAAQYLADLEVKEDDFISELKKHGVEKLNRMAAAERRKAKAPAIPAAASEPDAMTVSLEGMGGGQTPGAASPAVPESLEEPRFRTVTALADAAVGERLAGMQVYLVERSGGRIMVSVHPDKFVSPD